MEVRVAGDAEAVAVWVEVNEFAFGESYGDVGRLLLRALEHERPRDLGVIAYAGGEPVVSGTDRVQRALRVREPVGWRNVGGVAWARHLPGDGARAGAAGA